MSFLSFGTSETLILTPASIKEAWTGVVCSTFMIHNELERTEEEESNLFFSLIRTGSLKVRTFVRVIDLSAKYLIKNR